jgi:ESS family glutamate:Na+ symporter
LGALSDNVGPLVILAVGSVAWSIVLVLVIGRRVFERDWFEHSIAEFGEGQGNVATGFMMVDMVDPARQTGVVRGYSYRQLFTRPLVGGGSSPRFQFLSLLPWVFQSSRSSPPS